MTPNSLRTPGAPAAARAGRPGEAAGGGVPGRAAELELEHAAPLPDLLDAVLAAGTLTVCTQCAARRGITADDVLPGVRIAGAAVFVEEALREGAQALVY